MSIWEATVHAPFKEVNQLMCLYNLVLHSN